MTYYCTVHRDEDQQALVGEKLDACTSHMVEATGYDLEGMRNWVHIRTNYVIWEMERDETAKYGWRFKCLVGIPA